MMAAIANVWVQSPLQAFLILCIALALPFHPTLFDEINVSVADPVLALYILIFAISLVSVLFHRVWFGIALYVLLASISSIVGSGEPHFSSSDFALQLLKLTVSLGFLALGIHLQQSPGIANLFLRTTVLLASIFAVFSVVEVFVAGSVARASFPFSNPNAYAAFLVFAFAIACRDLITRSNLLMAVFAVAATGGGLLATGSRGAMAGLSVGIVGAAASLVFRKNYAGTGSRRAGLLAVACVVGALGIGAWVVASDNAEAVAVQRVTASFEGEGRNVTIRLALWKVASEAFDEAPILGIGLGQFPAYADRAIGAPLVTHNTYLSVLAETGIAGLFLLGAFLVYLLRCAHRCLRRDAQAAWLVVFLLAVLTHGLFANVDNFRVLWIFVGILMAQAVEQRAGGTQRQRTTSTPLPIGARNRRPAWSPASS